MPASWPRRATAWASPRPFASTSRQPFPSASPQAFASASQQPFASVWAWPSFAPPSRRPFVSASRRPCAGRSRASSSRPWATSWLCGRSSSWSSLSRVASYTANGPGVPGSPERRWEAELHRAFDGPSVESYCGGSTASRPEAERPEGERLRSCRCGTRRVDCWPCPRRSRSCRWGARSRSPRSRAATCRRRGE